MYGKEPLENKIPQKGLCLKRVCIMIMTVLSNEYKGGCILTFLLGRGEGLFQKC